jgi:hypothetical protein
MYGAIATPDNPIALLEIRHGIDPEMPRELRTRGTAE